MKKRYASLLAYGLFATLALYNCKDHDTPPPTPDFEKEVEGIVVETVTLTTPPAVTAQSGTFSAPTTTTVSGYTGGAPTQTMQNTASQVSSTLNNDQIAAINSVTPAQLQAVANGGALPAEVSNALNEIKKNPALASFLPTFALPTVNGTTVNGRTGLPELLEPVEAIKADDACLKKASDALAKVIEKLKADAKTEQDKVEAAYQKQVTDATAAETSCKSGIPATFTGYRTAAKTQFDATIATLDQNQAALGSFYGTLKALVVISYASALDTINTLEKAETAACTAKKNAAIANADAAKTENINKVTAALNKGLTTANAKITELSAACHNQGGGR
ncbi:hypothetical protein [Telluribacter sp. SYSU D00476]|uniref:hypothetical protein n=1 Tax=Telluribacter sp. SYSU D00476 TaxID=2811430 RepID=UPI001FF6F3BD|nr:hypothetical protein [Telluribacter sp. SYSU D00476]